MSDTSGNGLFSQLRTRLRDEVIRETITYLTGMLSGEAPGESTETAMVSKGVPVRKEKLQRKPGTGSFSKIRECIAPRCKHVSKGPRFRYLCENHMEATLKNVEAWRETLPERKPNW